MKNFSLFFMCLFSLPLRAMIPSADCMRQKFDSKKEIPLPPCDSFAGQTLYKKKGLSDSAAFVLAQRMHDVSEYTPSRRNILFEGTTSKAVLCIKVKRPISSNMLDILVDKYFRERIKDAF